MHAKLRTERIVSTTDRRRNLSSEKCDGRYRERSGAREMRALRAAFGRVLDHGQRDIEFGRSHRGRESRTRVHRMDSYGSDGMSIGCAEQLATAVGELSTTIGMAVRRSMRTPRSRPIGFGAIASGRCAIAIGQHASDTASDLPALGTNASTTGTRKVARRGAAIPYINRRGAAPFVEPHPSTPSHPKSRP